MAKPLKLKVFPVGLLATLLPLVTIHLCLLISIAQGYLSFCNPYWVSCHSVSATGRHGLAYFLFKGGMLSAMVLLAGFWVVNYLWLKQLRVARGKSLLWLGPLASVALIVYTLSLGHSGGAFYIARRAGVVTYLGLTFVAQTLFSAALKHSLKPTLARQGGRLLRLNAMMLGIAVFTLILDAMPMVDYEPLEDMVEWWLILLLNLHAIAVVLLWRRERLAIQLTAI